MYIYILCMYPSIYISWFLYVCVAAINLRWQVNKLHFCVLPNDFEWLLEIILYIVGKHIFIIHVLPRKVISLSYFCCWNLFIEIFSMINLTSKLIHVNINTYVHTFIFLWMYVHAYFGVSYSQFCFRFKICAIHLLAYIHVYVCGCMHAYIQNEK